MSAKTAKNAARPRPNEPRDLRPIEPAAQPATVSITNDDVMSALPALREIAMFSLPIRSALKFRRIMRQLAERAADLEAERDKLQQQFCKKAEDGKLVQEPVKDERDQVIGFTVPFLSPEAGQEYRKAVQEMLPLTLDGIEPIRPEDFGESVELKPELLVRLGDLLVD